MKSWRIVWREGPREGVGFFKAKTEAEALASFQKAHPGAIVTSFTEDVRDLPPKGVKGFF